MIGLSVPWPISAMRFPTRPSVIFSNATGYPPHRSGNTRPAGQTSFEPIRQCSGTDFFSVEVLTLRGLVTYYVLFFIRLESRQVEIAGVTRHPAEGWMKQIARNMTLEGWGFLEGCRYLLHDRDSKYTRSFRAIIEAGLVKTLPLPARSPNLNAYAERWVRSVKEECLSRLILFSAASLRRALNEFVAHYHAERNHQGRGNVLLFPGSIDTSHAGAVQCRERL